MSAIYDSLRLSRIEQFLCGSLVPEVVDAALDSCAPGGCTEERRVAEPCPKYPSLSIAQEFRSGHRYCDWLAIFVRGISDGVPIEADGLPFTRRILVGLLLLP
jgi:hypothetical protein